MKRGLTLAAGLLLACLQAGNAMASILPLANVVQGKQQVYTVKAGDTLSSIASQYGVDRDVLAVTNHLDPNSYSAQITIGEHLDINNRHIVPGILGNGILINLAQRRIYLFKDGKSVDHFLIAAGDPDWQTPIGKFHVINHIKGKTWIVPKSIQEEMRKKGQKVITSVPPGPDNPLGGYWVGTSLTNIGIHGTIDPNSVGRYESHGCMRMRHEDIERFFSKVKVGDTGETMYASVMLAKTADGKIWLEVHPDVYHKEVDPFAIIKRIADNNNLSGFIDWNQVAKVIDEREGIAQPVGQLDDYRKNLQDWMQSDKSASAAAPASADTPVNVPTDASVPAPTDAPSASPAAGESPANGK